MAKSKDGAARSYASYTKQRLYKVLVKGHSAHRSNMKWSLPKKRDDGGYDPGDWHEVEGKVVACANGLHFTPDPTEWWLDDCDVYEVEARGVIEVPGDPSKVAAKRARLLRPVTRDGFADAMDDRKLVSVKRGPLVDDVRVPNAADGTALAIVAATMQHVYRKRAKLSTRRQGYALYDAAELAIKSGAAFALDDANVLVGLFGRHDKWMSDHGVERLYKLACKHRNDSAAKSFEKFLGRTPFVFESARLAEGSDVVIGNERWKLHRFRDEKGTAEFVRQDHAAADKSHDSVDVESRWLTPAEIAAYDKARLEAAKKRKAEGGYYSGPAYEKERDRRYKREKFRWYPDSPEQWPPQGDNVVAGFYAMAWHKVEVALRPVSERSKREVWMQRRIWNDSLERSDHDTWEPLLSEDWAEMKPAWAHEARGAAQAVQARVHHQQRLRDLDALRQHVRAKIAETEAAEKTATLEALEAAPDAERAGLTAELARIEKACVDAAKRCDAVVPTHDPNFDDHYED